MMKSDGDHVAGKKKAAAKSKMASEAQPVKRIEASEPEPEKTRFPVVAIGGSAGSLNAFELFFKSMPSNSGMAFIIIAHLDPDHSTILHELLQKYTGMKIQLANDGMRIMPENVYVMPPNKSMAVKYGVLQLFSKLKAFGSNMPIDSFFRSLSEEFGNDAVAIIMSGAGADGAIGLRAIKDEGGMVMAQEAASAKYDSMPTSAIATGDVDYVLPPEKMPEQLVAYFKSGHSLKPEEPILDKRDEPALRKIFALLKKHTSHDFSLYKYNTVSRRIARRMRTYNMTNIAAYADYMQANPPEIRHLFKDLLIGVTNFFRDPEAFEALKTKVIPRLFEDKPDGYSFRIWVPACATGEEAYSLAILFLECMEETGRNFSLQLFGTDIDDIAIETARKGIFPLSIAADVSQKRLKANFIHLENGYRIRKEIRDMIIFAKQDVAKDPPFIKMDLISCRNLLIYMEPQLQKRVIPLFHYGLKPGGYLFLGFSETIGGNADLFLAVDKKWKISKRLGDGPSSFGTEHVVDIVGSSDRLRGLEVKAADDAGEPGIAHLIQATLMDHVAPPCVVVDDENRVLFVHGRTGKFLEPAAGAENFDLLEMARPGLRSELNLALKQARQRKEEVVYRDIKVSSLGRKDMLTLKVKPLTGARPLDKYFLVIFEVTERLPEAAGGKKPGAKRKNKTVEALESELNATKADLEVTIQELQGTNEEIRSANEELQSSNEELQSSNEELETSKEELQSLNEELVTVNTELQGRIEELARVNDDLKNFFDATAIATIFLDNKLHVKRFTPKSTKVVNLIESDIGRPISDLTTNLIDNNLALEASKVMQTLVPIEKELKGKDGSHFLMRVLPYRTINNLIDGVVLTFFDITSRKRSELAANDARNFAESIVETIREPLIVLDSRLRVVSANRAFYQTFKIDPRDTVKKYVYEIGRRQMDIPRLRELLENVIPLENTVDNYEVELEFPGTGCRRFQINARLVAQATEESKLILVALIEVTGSNK